MQDYPPVDFRDVFSASTRLYRPHAHADGTIGDEIGHRLRTLSAGMSPFKLVDEVLGERLVRQLDALGYHVR